MDSACAGQQLINQPFQNFAIMRQCKIKSTLQYSEALSTFPLIWLEKPGVTSMKHSFSQIPLHFICVEHEDSQHRQ